MFNLLASSRSSRSLNCCQLLLAGMILTSLCGCERSEEETAAKPAATPATSNEKIAQKPPASTPPPKNIQIDLTQTGVYAIEPNVNFGVQMPGSKIEHLFTLVNPTNQPITIVTLKPTCECTTANSVDGKTIPAMGTIEVPISFQLPNTSGTKRAAVNMVLSTGRGPRLSLQAESSYAVRTKPLFIDAFSNPQNARGTVTLESIDGKPFRVLSVAGQPPVIPNNPNGANDARTTQIIQYDLNQFPCTSMPKWLLIETDHPGAPLLMPRVRHQCTKLRHQVDPNFRPQINFDGWISNAGFIPAGGSGEFNVGVKKPGGMLIDAVVSTSPDFKAELIGQNADDENRLLVKARITPLTNKTGVFEIPVQFISGRRAESLLLVGTVR